MSDEHMDVARRIHAAWAAGEPASGLIAEDVVYVNPVDAVEPGTKQGIEMFDRVNDVYETFHTEPERMIDLGDRVLVMVSGTGRTRASGMTVPFRLGYIWTVHEGRAVRFEWFTSPENALAAAGLEAGDQEGGETSRSG